MADLTNRDAKLAVDAAIRSLTRLSLSMAGAEVGGVRGVSFSGLADGSSLSMKYSVNERAVSVDLVQTGTSVTVSEAFVHCAAPQPASAL